MSRQPYREIPRWQRDRYPRGHQVVLSRRDGRRLVRQLAEQSAVQQSPAQPGTPAARGTFHPVYRFRYQLIPVWWLAGAAIAGPGLHAIGRDRAGVVAGLAAAALIWLVTRHKKGNGRKLCTAMAALTALWVPVLAMTGLAKPWPAIALICWAAVLIPWCHHYRWRREEVQQPAQAHGDQEIWGTLAAKRHWSGHLASRRDIPAGRQWDIVLNGSETDIGEVMAHPRKIAAAWGKATTEAFAEPAPDGVESRGVLTILRTGTLAATREWNGAGVDPQTGIATIGRYADGKPARIRLFAPRDGVRHGLISGATGSGKTYLLDLLVRACLACGFIVPVILDPQEGQSLPQWRGRVPYASGVYECMAMLRGLRAGMLDRSRYLSGLDWTDEDGHRMRGMDFYDHDLSGLPMVLVIGDEYPVLLTDRQHGAEAIEITADLGKRGRKTGVALWPVAQVPSLSELGDQVVRSMLVGGNVVCLRTGDRVSAGMLGLLSDPSALPRYFADGSPTYGLGYVIGPDMRQAAARIDLVPRSVRRQVPAVPELDDRFAEAMGAAMAVDPIRALAWAVQSGLVTADEETTRTLRLATEIDNEPAGHTCMDAVLAVLDRTMTKGEIMTKAARLVTSEWGRSRPFTARAFSDAFIALAEAGQIRKDKHNTYAPARPALTVLAGSGGRPGDAS